MADTFAGQLYPPRSDAWIARNGVPEALALVDATSTATTVPGDGDVAYVDSAEAEALCAFVDLTGTVSTLTLSLYTLQGDIWYWHSDYELDPSKGSQRVDLLILGKYSSFTVQVSEISGGGTAAVSVLGVWT